MRYLRDAMTLLNRSTAKCKRGLSE